MSNKLNINPGDQYGHWTVVEEVNKNNKRYWQCKCICGNEKVVIQSALVSGKSKSCGCKKESRSVVDLTGKVFGRLTVNRLSHKENKRSVWNCKCECGNHIQVKGSYLTQGEVRSCGCLKREVNNINLKDKLHEKYVDDVNTSLLTQKIKSNNTSGVKGVSQHKASGKWDAYISVNKRRIHLGRYINKVDAIRKRQEAELKYHKPYLEVLENEQRRNKTVD